MKLKDFKEEFRCICTDTWGDALDAHFEIGGRMYKRNMPIPSEWEYRPGLGDPCERDSYWHGIFAKCTNKQLKEIGNFLFRYCRFLKFKGVDY